MKDLLQQLFHTTKAKDFATLFREIEKKCENPKVFLTEVASYLPSRLYERYYQETIPHSFFGLISAHTVQSLLPENQQWRPFAQQCWFATQEQKRTPLNIKKTQTKTVPLYEDRWLSFTDATVEHNFSRILQETRGFLTETTGRDFFRKKSLLYAMEDNSYGGHKFIYLYQAWRLAEALKWRNTEEILTPALHFLTVAPRDESLAKTIREIWNRNSLPSQHQFAKNTGEISPELYQETETTLLFNHDLGDSFSLLATLANSGVSLQEVQDTLILIAAQSLSNSDTGLWIWPMRAFHFSYMSQQLVDWDPSEKTFALLMSAALLNKASIDSCDVKENRTLDEVAQQLCPVDPMNVLKSVISHSDPHASATAIHTILGIKDNGQKELFQTLLSQAVKNDGKVCYGHDLLYVYEAFDCYGRCRLEEKNKLAISAGYFLGRVNKRYEFFGAYGF